MHLQNISKSLSDLTENMMLNRALGSISEVLDILSTNPIYAESFTLIRSELMKINETAIETQMMVESNRVEKIEHNDYL